MILDLLRRNRAQIERDLVGHERRRYFSPVFYVQYRAVVPLIGRHSRGRVIDLGCGFAPFRKAVAPGVTTYDTLDYVQILPDQTYIADLQSMPMVPAGHYDFALCLEVLEHLPDPLQALHEIYRILAPGSLLIVSVPHISRLHDLPHDYYRYTEHGLRHLLLSVGFDVVEIQGKGGLLTFLGHQVSTALVPSTWRVPVLGKVSWLINKYLVTLLCVALDSLVDTVVGRQSPFVQGYVAVARKRLLVEGKVVDA